MRKYSEVIFCMLAVVSNIAVADSWSIKFSDASVPPPSNLNPEGSHTPGGSNTEVFRFTEDDPSGVKTYVSKNVKRKLDPSSKKDVSQLANSIEFEVYEVSESQTGHTVFYSGAGICRGFKSKQGVELTDSRTYYVTPDESEYYASIAGATVYDNSEPNNVQYAPVFNVKDPELARRLQEDEYKYGKVVATRHIKRNSDMLADTICK